MLPLQASATASALGLLDVCLQPRAKRRRRGGQATDAAAHAAAGGHAPPPGLCHGLRPRPAPNGKELQRGVEAMDRPRTTLARRVAQLARLGDLLVSKAEDPKSPPVAANPVSRLELG